MDYTGQGRTNYVAVTDEEKFRKLCAEFSASCVEKDGKLGFITNDDSGEADLPDENNIGEERRLIDEIVPLLLDNEVLIFTHIGYEGNRYYGGYAIALNNKGERADVDIHRDIIEKAKALTSAPDNIIEATY